MRLFFNQCVYCLDLRTCELVIRKGATTGRLDRAIKGGGIGL